MLLATGNAWAAASQNGCLHSGGQANGCGGGAAQAPEIDAASGTAAIALLTGVLLLVGERKRSKRSSHADDKHTE
jgi:hypothetical protein